MSDYLAERERFELSEPLPARRFSRPFPSTTRAPLQKPLITIAQTKVNY